MVFNLYEGNLYIIPPNIIMLIKSMKIRWAANVALTLMLTVFRWEILKGICAEPRHVSNFYLEDVYRFVRICIRTYFFILNSQKLFGI
jgi:hypothetical protein